MEVIKRAVYGGVYYYLEHTYRHGSKVIKKSMYLGKAVPDNVRVLKEELMDEIYSEIYYDRFEEIKKIFSEELNGMPASARKKELENFSVGFTYNTQRIEGSTLSLKETSGLLIDGISPASKPLDDVKEAESHKKVFYLMLDSKSMSLTAVLKWHKLLLGSTRDDVAGRIRNHKVSIAGSSYIPPTFDALEDMLKEFYSWYNKSKKTMNPVKLAALVHFKFVSIHPFSDGNGRISRLMMNYVLKEFDYPLLDIKYEARRSYYTALENANKRHDPNVFVRWFFKRYLKEYSKYLD